MGSLLRNVAGEKIGKRENEWRRPGSNRQPLACKASALPIELRPREGALYTRGREGEKWRFLLGVVGGVVWGEEAGVGGDVGEVEGVGGGAAEGEESAWESQ